MKKIKLICAVGTRPEAIKMAPVILALRREAGFDVRVLATAQHRDMLDQVLRIFDIKPDIDLDIMKPNQDLTSLTARLLLALDKVLRIEKPSVLLAQGDTTTVMTAALACFYHNIPFGHVEAGLRTGDLQNPFPEEMNRLLAGRLARWHFAPTESARANLLREGTAADTIHVTGNTVIDALQMVAAQQPQVGLELDAGKRLILVTAHRRENFGAPLETVFRAIRTLAEQRTDIQFLYPVHPNPNVQQAAQKFLAGHARILLCPPLDYLPFVGAMQRAYMILSDSGGVQEEAPALARPVLVLRRTSERPEAIEAGVVRLVGPDYNEIIHWTTALLDNEVLYRRMARGVSPYGDGHAAPRICQILREAFHV